ncbi:MAG: TPM domain-containing protein [Deltaproteobacteria bacterium]|nr:TPM domain-containing protein [Deltaproteobacteria bacterium]
MGMTRSKRPGAFLTDEEKARVASAIAAAEKETSGEIRVVISRKVRGGVLDAAKDAFRRLKMHETRERNAVLILVATVSRAFAILGDEGVHRHLGQEGWDHIRDGMAERFRQGDVAGGLVHAVSEVGTVLARHFPWRADDRDELPNDVVEE